VRYIITWVEQKSATITATDIKAAEAYARQLMGPETLNPKTKLLSIVTTDPATPLTLQMGPVGPVPPSAA
jgi:hypothetical protein